LLGRYGLVMDSGERLAILERQDFNRRALEMIDRALAEPHRLQRQLMIAEAVRLHRLSVDAAARAPRHDEEPPPRPETRPPGRVH